MRFAGLCAGWVDRLQRFVVRQTPRAVAQASIHETVGQHRTHPRRRHARRCLEISHWREHQKEGRNERTVRGSRNGGGVKPSPHCRPIRLAVNPGKRSPGTITERREPLPAAGEAIPVAGAVQERFGWCGAGGVASRQPTQSRYIYRAAKTNVVTDKKTSPLAYDAVSRRIGTPRCPCWTRWMEYRPGFCWVAIEPQIRWWDQPVRKTTEGLQRRRRRELRRWNDILPGAELRQREPG